VSKTTHSNSNSNDDGPGSGASTPNPNHNLSPNLSPHSPASPHASSSLGITNAKIRLYARESASKWRDMGSARLSILLPPRPASLSPAPGQAAPVLGTLALARQKRVLVCGATRGERLLDVVLGEDAFERVARTGIAISVPERLGLSNGEGVDVLGSGGGGGGGGVGGVKAVGGVNGVSSRVYMVQMKSVSGQPFPFSCFFFFSSYLLLEVLGVLADLFSSYRTATPLSHSAWSADCATDRVRF